MKEKKISEYFGKYINVLEVCDGSFHVKSPPKNNFLTQYLQTSSFLVKA